MRKSLVCGCLCLTLCSNATSLAHASDIYIKIEASRFSSLNYQLYFDDEPYMSNLEFELVSLRNRESIKLTSVRSYLYLRGLNFGTYDLIVKSKKFDKSFRIVIDQSSLDDHHITKILDLDKSSLDNLEPSPDQLFPLDKNKFFPEISDPSHPDHPNNEESDSSIGDSIKEWFDKIYHIDFHVPLFPSIGGEDDNDPPVGDDDSSDNDSDNSGDEDVTVPDDSDKDDSDDSDSNTSNDDEPSEDGGLLEDDNKYEDPGPNQDSPITNGESDFDNSLTLEDISDLDLLPQTGSKIRTGFVGLILILCGLILRREVSLSDKKN